MPQVECIVLTSKTDLILIGKGKGKGKGKRVFV